MEKNMSQYKKSMALVWLAVLSPLLAIILVLAAIVIPYLITAKTSNVKAFRDTPAGEAMPTQALTGHDEQSQTKQSRTTPEDNEVTVHLHNGNSFNAKIEQESDDNISFAIDGGTFTLPRSDILRIER